MASQFQPQKAVFRGSTALYHHSSGQRENDSFPPFRLSEHLGPQPSHMYCSEVIHIRGACAAPAVSTKSQPASQGAHTCLLMPPSHSPSILTPPLPLLSGLYLQPLPTRPSLLTLSSTSSASKPAVPATPAHSLRPLTVQQLSSSLVSQDPHATLCPRYGFLTAFYMCLGTCDSPSEERETRTMWSLPLRTPSLERKSDVHN